jgi:hypothetical protein
MNAEDLIIAHFDRSLTVEQEAELQQLLADSPDARTLFERHEAMESMMEKDSAALAPSRELDEVVIASALGLLSGAGGGAALWFSGKIAAAVSAVAVGGLAIALVTTSAPEKTPAPAQKNIPPAALRLPTLPQPAEAPVIEESVSTPVTQVPAEDGSRATRTEIQRPASKPAASKPAGNDPKINIPTDNPTTITHPPKVDGNGSHK